jgi:hypothetical protein
MPSFEPLNKIVCTRHAGMFKHDKYTFHPQKEDLILSMPYEFVANLKPGQFTSLDNLWLKSVNKILKKGKDKLHKTNKAYEASKKAFLWKSNHDI